MGAETGPGFEQTRTFRFETGPGFLLAFSRSLQNQPLFREIPVRVSTKNMTCLTRNACFFKAKPGPVSGKSRPSLQKHVGLEIYKQGLVSDIAPAGFGHALALPAAVGCKLATRPPESRPSLCKSRPCLGTRVCYNRAVPAQLAVHVVFGYRP